MEELRDKCDRPDDAVGHQDCCVIVTGAQRQLSCDRAHAFLGLRASDPVARRWPRQTHRTSVPGFFASSDGAVEFRIEAHGHQVFLTRTQRRPPGSLMTMSMNFADRHAFASWCETEPLRFDHPLLFDRLRRHVDGAFVRGA